ncbi:MAG: response regulator transcription factor [Acidobacteriota bacterium]
MPSVLLCSDEPILAEGLIQILKRPGNLELVAWCSRVEDLQEQLERYAPDLLLMDLTAEVHFGLLERIQSVAAQTKIVLWVRSIAGELALQAMSLGIRGVLRKTLPPETLLRCLALVHAGELWFEKALTDSLTTTRRHALTPREGQLVALLSQGLKNKEIATAMELSEGSVKVYLSRLFHKLGVKDRLELALFGLKNLTPGMGAIAPGQSPELPPWQAPRSFFVDKPAAVRAVRQ